MQTKPISLHNLMSSAEFKKKVDYIRGIGEQRLYEAIWDNVYMVYTPQYYTRTYELLNSVSSSVEYGTTSIKINVFCDSNKMNHFAHKPYGTPVYVPVLLDGGHTQEGYEGTRDMYHDYPATNFLNDAIKQIEKDLSKMLANVIITAFRPSKAYKL